MNGRRAHDRHELPRRPRPRRSAACASITATATGVPARNPVRVAQLCWSPPARWRPVGGPNRSSSCGRQIEVLQKQPIGIPGILLPVRFIAA